MRAWQSLDRFEGRSSLRTWLYRIATNVCLDALASRARRARPIEEGPVCTVDDDLEARPRTHWLEPIPDARCAAVRRRSARAHGAASEHPSRVRRGAAASAAAAARGAAAQRSARLVGRRSRRVLETSVPAVNSALQRARATLAARNVALDRARRLAVGRGVRSARSLRRRLPAPTTSTRWWRCCATMRRCRCRRTRSGCRGPTPSASGCTGAAPAAAARACCRVSASGVAGVRAVPPASRTAPTRPGRSSSWSSRGGRISAWNTFLDTEKLFPLFGLPLHMSD